MTANIKQLPGEATPPWNPHEVRGRNIEEALLLIMLRIMYDKRIISGLEAWRYWEEYR